MMLVKTTTKKKYQEIDKQRDFMDKMFVKLRLTKLEDWKKVSHNKYCENGGKAILYSQYGNKFNDLLSTIYPNYPWYFEEELSIEKQRKIMEKLSLKFKLTSLNDWLKISTQQINSQIEGKRVFKIYNNKYKLLRALYPTHKWNFDKNSKKELEILQKKTPINEQTVL